MKRRPNSVEGQKQKLNKHEQKPQKGIFDLQDATETGLHTFFFNAWF